ncbi:hypothetical protein GGS21DRAFT_51163 [Xylaria nigripes]|nr:hypothetical protein GGS21DRAFT_51163 [Xylaria nigripes]
MSLTTASLSPIETVKNMNHTPRVLTPIVETEFESEYPIASTFHSDADLKVIIQVPNADPTIYMVCASALSCASREWRCMLYRNAAHFSHVKDEANQNQTLTLHLAGDAEAIGTIFRIVHYDFIYVPQEPTFDQLYELGKSACQYKCTHIFYPWASRWVSRLSNFGTQDNCFSECHKALYVGWAFGDLQLYRDAVDTLIVSSKLNAGGKLVNVSGQSLEDMPMPPYILGIITEIRASTVANILRAIKTPIQALSSDEQGQHTEYCKVGKDSKACEIMMLGSAVSTLTKLGLFPVPEAETFAGSIEDLKSKLENIQTIPYVGRDWMPHLSHENCNLGFRKSVKTCLTGMAVPLSACIMSWISNQADICGIQANEELREWRLKSGSPSKLSEEPTKMHTPNKGVEDLCDSSSLSSIETVDLKDPSSEL